MTFLIRNGLNNWERTKYENMERVFTNDGSIFLQSEEESAEDSFDDEQPFNQTLGDVRFDS